MDYSPEERDLAVRTILAEAGSQGVDGQLAVANVIRNRVASGNYGDGLGGVVTKKYAFEPMLHYGTGQGNDPARFSEAEPAYQQAARILDATLAGGAPDNTGGATHFISKSLQAADGRDLPSWAQGKPLAQIGGHSFYAPEGKIKMDDSTLDPNLVAQLARSSTATPGQQAAQMFQQRQGGAAPAGPATPGQLGPLADLFKKMGQGGGMAPGGAGGQQTPFLQRMIWGDQGFNGALGKVSTPNNGQGFLGGMFGGPQSLPTPPGGTAPQLPGAGTGGAAPLTVPPVMPVESAPLAAPAAADAPAIAAPMVTEAAAPAIAAAAPVAEGAAAAAPALAAAAPAAAAGAAGAGAAGLSGLASLFALI